MFKCQIKKWADQNNTHKYVFQSAITSVLLKHRNSTTDILSLLGHSYVHFHIRPLLFTLSDFKCFLKVRITFNMSEDIVKVSFIINGLKITFFQKPTQYINHPTDQHCRSTGWPQYDVNVFQKGFFHRQWYYYSLICQLQN